MGNLRMRALLFALLHAVLATTTYAFPNPYTVTGPMAPYMAYLPALLSALLFAALFVLYGKTVPDKQAVNLAGLLYLALPLLFYLAGLALPHNSIVVAGTGAAPLWLFCAVALFFTGRHRFRMGAVPGVAAAFFTVLYLVAVTLLYSRVDNTLLAETPVLSAYLGHLQYALALAAFVIYRFLLSRASVGATLYTALFWLFVPMAAGLVEHFWPNTVTAIWADTPLPFYMAALLAAIALLRGSVNAKLAETRRAQRRQPDLQGLFGGS